MAAQRTVEVRSGSPIRAVLFATLKFGEARKRCDHQEQESKQSRQSDSAPKHKRVFGAGNGPVNDLRGTGPKAVDGAPQQKEADSQLEYWVESNIRQAYSPFRKIQRSSSRQVGSADEG
jgi:hypothetical protein